MQNGKKITTYLLIKVLKLLLDFSSIDKGETAIGNGFKLPLVISTSIKLYDFTGKNKIKHNNGKSKLLIINFIFNLQAFLLRQNLIVTL